jgi:hypothetical protein
MTATGDGSTLPTLVVHLERERARALVRGAFPRRKWKIISTRSAEELEEVFRRVLVDAAIIDVGTPDEDTWKAAAFAAEFPSAPFFAVMPLRASDTPAAARCASLGFIDIIVEGLDENAARDLFPPPFDAIRRALGEPPQTLGLTTPLQRQPGTSSSLIRAACHYEGAGKAVGLSREHLSCNFAKPGAPNLKRVIDLVRLLSAARPRIRSRHPRHRPHPGLRVVVPPRRNRAKDFRDPACFSRSSENHGSHRPICSRQNAQPKLTSRLLGWNGPAFPANPMLPKNRACDIFHKLP